MIILFVCFYTTQLFICKLNHLENNEVKIGISKTLKRMNLPFSRSLDPFIFPLALKSSTFLCCPHLGASIHALTIKSSFIENPFVACGLVDLYGKCVSVHSARQLFDEIPMRNVVDWNSMISLYTHSKDMDSALKLFNRMNFAPNVSTFNTLMKGLVETENGFHDVISLYGKMQEMNIEPNLITLLGLLRGLAPTKIKLNQFKFFIINRLNSDDTKYEFNNTQNIA